MSEKYLTLVVFILLLFSCKSENTTPAADKKEIKENYGTGETSRVYTRINGAIEGKMTDYFPSGKIMGERFFKNNKQTGKTTVFFESGKIKEVQYYADGLKNGGDTLFYENGQIQYVSEFKDEKKNGYLRKWDEDGALVYEAKFAMDTLIEVGGKSVRSQSAKGTK